jgi:hypothetical protein
MVRTPMGGEFCYHSVCKRKEQEMNTWDFVVAALIGLIDLNPLWDLIFVPLSWALLFWA